MARDFRSGLDRDLQGRLQSLPPADWVLAMRAHYRRTGAYRASDLRRLLGDPNRAVEVGPKVDLASVLLGRA